MVNQFYSESSPVTDIIGDVKQCSDRCALKLRGEQNHEGNSRFDQVVSTRPSPEVKAPCFQIFDFNPYALELSNAPLSVNIASRPKISTRE